MDENYYETIILAALLLDPTGFQVTADGTKVYLLGNDNKLVKLEGEGLHLLSDEEVEKWIVRKLKK